MIDKEKPFITRPSNSRTFHIFNPDLRSKCGKMALLFPDWDNCEEFKGTETFSQGQDCKACFKKAGLTEVEA